MGGPVRAILWAQWKTLLHFRAGGRVVGTVLSGLILAGWFGIWTLIAGTLGLMCAQPSSLGVLEQALGTGLCITLLFWQMAPLAMASQGASLDFKKLLVYPIPADQLFAVDVALRLTSGVEIIILCTGVAAGLVWNPAVPLKAAPAVFLLFVIFNLLLASGLRQQLERLLARRGLREILALLFILSAALPQLFVARGMPAQLRGLLSAALGPWWPWSAAARLALGHTSWTAWLTLLSWIVVAGAYGRWQFRRSLRADQEAAPSAARSPARPGSLGDSLYRLPSRFLPEPLAALVEKELRSLARSPRFRLLFIMGFTFGILIFTPIMMRQSSHSGVVSAHRLTMIAAYSLLLLGDTVFWNIFGFDRVAAKLYFLIPSPFAWVLVSKNLAAAAFIFLEVTGVGIVWSLLRMPVSPGMFLEAYLVTFVLCLYLLAAGNFASLSYPRAANPARSMGSASSARVRIVLLLAYPILALPVVLAFLAEYAFRSRPAFYAVLAFAVAIGSVFYWVGLGSAAAKAERRKEQFLDTLSQSEGPVSM